MGILQAGKYALLTLHAALFCWICMAVDEVLRIWAALAKWGGGAARGLQYAMLALSLIGVLVLVGLLDKKLSRAKSPGELVNGSCLVLMIQLFVLGGATVIPAMAGMKSWLLPAVTLPVGGIFLIYFLLRGRAWRKRQMDRK